MHLLDYQSLLLSFRTSSVVGLYYNLEAVLGVLALAVLA